MNDEELDSLRPGSADSRLTPQRPISRASPAPSSSGASSGDEDEPNELDDEGARRSITQPALVTPTALSSPGSPWPFGGIHVPGAPKRGSLNGSIASTIVGTRLSIYEPDTIVTNGSTSAKSNPALPHEILLHILKLVHATADLRACLTVSKSWCQCGVELLWHKPSFHRAEALRRTLLVLSSAGQTFPYATFIKRLNFSALAPDGINDVVLHQLVACERLERLTIAANTQVTDAGVIAVLHVCKNLVALDVSDCANITDATCLVAAQNCKRLQGLNLSGCKEVTDDGVIAIAEACLSLRRIKLRYVEHLTDTPLVLLARNCSHLLEVDIIGCVRVTDVALWAIWRCLSHLREFSLASCSELSDQALPQKDTTTHAVPVVLLRGEELMHAVPPSINGQTAYRRIKDMKASGELRLMLPTPVSASNFTHLRSLDLTALSRLTDEGIAGVIDCIPKLRNLILAKCIGLTDNSIRSVCKLGRHLHYLHLGHVANITDAAVTELARSCTRLRYIDLACCPMLTDLSVTELAQNLPRLKRIGLVRVTHLTDEAIFALRERTSLERIHLSYCELITVQAISFLLQHLRKLTHLSLTGVPSFRRVELQQFCRQPPKDFNQHQRQTFCVYSGPGVSQLRDYLLSSQWGTNSSRNMGMMANARNILLRHSHFGNMRFNQHAAQPLHAAHIAGAHNVTQMADLQHDMDEDVELDEEEEDDGETISGDAMRVGVPMHGHSLPGDWQNIWDGQGGSGSAPASLGGPAVPPFVPINGHGGSANQSPAVPFDDDLYDESEGDEGMDMS